MITVCDGLIFGRFTNRTFKTQYGKQHWTPLEVFSLYKTLNLSKRVQIFIDTNVLRVTTSAVTNSRPQKTGAGLVTIRSCNARRHNALDDEQHCKIGRIFLDLVKHLPNPNCADWPRSKAPDTEPNVTSLVELSAWISVKLRMSLSNYPCSHGYPQ